MNEATLTQQEQEIMDSDRDDFMAIASQVAEAGQEPEPPAPEPPPAIDLSDLPKKRTRAEKYDRQIPAGAPLEVLVEQAVAKIKVEGETLESAIAKLQILWAERDEAGSRERLFAARRIVPYRCVECGQVTEALTPTLRQELSANDPARIVRCPNPEHPMGRLTVMELVLE